MFGDCNPGFGESCRAAAVLIFRGLFDFQPFLTMSLLPVQTRPFSYRFGHWGYRILPLVAILLVLAQAACKEKESFKPIGEANPILAKLKSNNWISYDTIISIDMQSGVEEIQTVENDYSPDTLADGTVVYSLVEHMPVLQPCFEDEDPVLCTQLKLNEIVRTDMRYPINALAQGREGSTVATFLIGPDGKTRQIGIEQSRGDELDRAVMTLIENLPAWNPGFMDGKPVTVRYKLPIQFTLPE